MKVQLYLGDAFASAIWLLVNVAAWAAAARLGRRAFPDDPPHQIAMHALTLLWTAIVAVSLVLGAAGFLYWQAMGAILLCVSVTILVGVSRQGATTAPTQQRQTAPPSWSGALTTTLWLGLAALAGGTVADRLMGFPKYRDDLMYHLPLVDHWVQDARLYAPGCAEWYNPGNGELLGLWWAAPVSGDFWVGLSNLPVVSLLVLATLEFGRELGLAPAIRQALAVAAVATNVVLIQLTDLENDVAVAALFVASLTYGARHARAGRLPDRWLAAACLGLLAGVKYYSLGYAVVGWAGIAGINLLARGRVPAARLTLAAVLAALALAGYWYFRNYLIMGTPVFPLGISEATDVLESVRPSAFRTTLFGNGRADLWLQYLDALRQLTGFCHVAAVVLIPATVVGLVVSAWLAVRTRGDRAAAALLIWLAFLVITSICVYGVTPFSVDDDDERKINGAFTVIRYSQCPVLLALAGAAVVLQKIVRGITLPLRNSAECGLGWALTLAAVLQLALRAREVVDADALLLAVNLALAGLIVAEIRRTAVSRRRLVAKLACVTAPILAAGASAWLSQRWHAGYAANFDYQFATRTFTDLEHVGKPPRIAIADYRYYPFFGSRRQFRAHRPFRILTRLALCSYIKQFRISLVAVIRRDPFTYGRYRGLADLLAREKERFEKTGSGAGFDLYRVKMPDLRGATAGERAPSITSALNADQQPTDALSRSHD